MVLITGASSEMGKDTARLLVQKWLYRLCNSEAFRQNDNEPNEITMDFTEHVITYYSTESKHSFTSGMASGIVLIATAILFGWFSNPLSILKGLAIIFLIGSLLFGVGGYFTGRCFI